MNEPLRAPFPWFGGKRRVAPQVWQAFGDVPNYCEPFFGSGAVLLGRPTPGRIETVNDLDCYLANFWRAVRLAPEDVAAHADWPVNEADLHARHLWLVYGDDKDPAAAFRERMKTEPGFFDAARAGWWVWGISQWIGGGWCALPKDGCRVERKRPEMKRGGRGVQGLTAGGEKRPFLGNSGRGTHGGRKTPQIGGTKGAGVHKRGLAVESRQRPHLSDTGRGVLHAPGNQHGYFRNGSPQGVNAVSLNVCNPKGIHARGVDSKMPKADRGTLSRLQPSQQLPCISGDGGATGRGIHASAMPWTIYDWMAALEERLRRVRVCCGQWHRILGPSPTTCIGLTAVFLDPPYPEESGRDPGLYAEESKTVAHDAAEWAMANGDNPKLRIAFCGYEGSHDFPKTWTTLEWKAAGGYGSQENAARERIWFSPHCLTVRQQLHLFDRRPA